MRLQLCPRLLFAFFALSAAAPFAGCAGAETSSDSPKKPHFLERIHAMTFTKGIFAIPSSGEFAKWNRAPGYGFAIRLDAKEAAAGGTLMSLNAPVASMKAPHDTVKLARLCNKTSVLLHPNQDFRLTRDELLTLDGFDLFEFRSSDDGANDDGDTSHPSAEELWDHYMTKKHRVFGIAADPKLEGYAVLAWDTGADQKSLCDALARGHFLVTKGARVAGLEVTSRAVEIGIDDWHPTTDHVDFIGAGGALLARVVSNPARYELRGGEGYVRAHVFQDRLEGSEKPRREAWTQAFFIR